MLWPLVFIILTVANGAAAGSYLEKHNITAGTVEVFLALISLMFFKESIRK